MPMRESFQKILEIQELDIKMIRLMRVKNERKRELGKVHALLDDIRTQVDEKSEAILDLKKEIRLGETRIREIHEKVGKLEEQQNAVRKMEEFNALTQEMTQAGRDKTRIEQELSDFTDKLTAEEDLLENLKEKLSATEKNSASLEEEIHESVATINEEGQELLKKREALIPQTDPEFFAIYEKLLHNKKDRVVVPIENRTCSGCHIVLTPQHENLVRRGERLVFCEHCSRILFWQEAEAMPEEKAPRRRRRRASGTAA